MSAPNIPRVVISTHHSPLDELAEADPCNLTGQITIDLSRRTGWGRFGDVYKGEYEGSNVCVKVLREVSVADADRLKKFFRRLKREIKVWHKMGDDNVIAFLGWTLQPVDGSLRVSLVSQWADGGNVTEFLRQNPDADRLGIVRGVCRGLAYLHSCGVVHGDIKPENVVVLSSTQTGPKPKLCDFRLSSVVDDFTTHAKAPSTMGTIRYTSPELMDGTVTGRDENSDVWAFGCTAAQILTSQVPYAWVSHQLQLSSAICQGPPYDVSNNTEFFANCIAACFESRRELRPSVAKLIQWLELEPGSLTSVSLINSLPRVIVMLHMLSLLQRLDDLPYLWRYQRNRDIAGLDAEFRKAIPVPVQTECCEWYRIIFRCSAGDINALDAFKMVVPLLLHWICAMSIMGKLEEALVGLYEMKNYIGDRTFGTLLCELHRMILQSRAAIRACSLSILGGLHPFVPWRSALRSYFPQMFSKGLLALIAPGFTRPDAEWPPLITTLEQPISWRISIAFSPDNRYLATSDNKLVRIWDMATGMTSRLLDGHTSLVTSVVFSFDGSYIASASIDKSVRIWNMVTGIAALTLNGHTDTVTSVAFSPDGRWLASASRDKSIRIWDVSSGVSLFTLNDHTDCVESVAFSPSGQYLGSASFDGSVRIWELSTMASVVLNGHSDKVLCIAFSNDGQFIASGSVDKSIRIWEVATATILHILTGHISRVECIAFSPDDLYLASVSRDMSVRIWGSLGEIASLVLIQHTQWVTSVAFSSDGRYMAAASSFPSVWIWHVIGGMSSFSHDGHRAYVKSIAFSPIDHYIASASYDKSVRVWDTAKEMTPTIFNGHRKAVTCVAFSPNGCYLASASNDMSVRVWNVAQAGELPSSPLVLSGHTDSVKSVAFAPNGHYLASASADKSLRIWDVATGKTVHHLDGHTKMVTSVAFSPNSNILASASEDNSVRIWDVVSGTVSPPLEDHEACVNCVTFSPDGNYLASASDDKSVRVWDTNTGTVLFILSALTECMKSVTFSPDSRYLLSTASHHHSAQCIWDLLAQKRVISNFHLNVSKPMSNVKQTPPMLITSPSPRPPWVILEGNSLCVKVGDVKIHFCWLPDHFRSRTPVVQNGSTVCVGGAGGEVVFADFSDFNFPEV